METQAEVANGLAVGLAPGIVLAIMVGVVYLIAKLYKILKPRN